MWLCGFWRLSWYLSQGCVAMGEHMYCHAHCFSECFFVCLFCFVLFFCFCFVLNFFCRCSCWGDLILHSCKDITEECISVGSITTICVHMSPYYERAASPCFLDWTLCPAEDGPGGADFLSMLYLAVRFLIALCITQREAQSSRVVYLWFIFWATKGFWFSVSWGSWPWPSVDFMYVFLCFF